MKGLKQAIFKSGKKKQEVANEVGCSRQFLNKLEKCERNPSLQLAEKLAKTLNCTIDELMKGEQTDERT